MRRSSVWVISRKKLKEAWERHKEWEAPLTAWHKITEAAEWRHFPEVKQTFGSADRVGTCVIFDIGGNKCRLITWINYTGHRVFIRHVLTHEEYDNGGWRDDCDCD
jgi:mRNA interferase HigB